MAAVLKFFGGLFNTTSEVQRTQTEFTVTKKDISTKKKVSFLTCELSYPTKQVHFSHLIRKCNLPLFQEAGLITLIMDSSFTIVACTNNAQTLTGSTPSELLGRDITILIREGLPKSDKNKTSKFAQVHEIIESQGFFTPLNVNIPTLDRNGLTATVFVIPYESYFVTLIQRIEWLRRGAYSDLQRFQEAISPQVQVKEVDIIEVGRFCAFKPEFQKPARDSFRQAVGNLSSTKFPKESDTTFKLLCNHLFEVVVVPNNFDALTGYFPREVLTKNLTQFIPKGDLFNWLSFPFEFSKKIDEMESGLSFPPIYTDFLLKGLDGEKGCRNAFPAKITIGKMEGNYYVVIINKKDREKLSLSRMQTPMHSPLHSLDAHRRRGSAHFEFDEKLSAREKQATLVLSPSPVRSPDSSPQMRSARESLPSLREALEKDDSARQAQLTVSQPFGSPQSSSASSLVSDVSPLSSPSDKTPKKLGLQVQSPTQLGSMSQPTMSASEALSLPGSINQDRSQ